MKMKAIQNTQLNFDEIFNYDLTKEDRLKPALLSSQKVINLKELQKLGTIEIIKKTIRGKEKSIIKFFSTDKSLSFDMTVRDNQEIKE